MIQHKFPSFEEKNTYELKKKTFEDNDKFDKNLE